MKRNKNLTSNQIIKCMSVICNVSFSFYFHSIFYPTNLLTLLLPCNLKWEKKQPPWRPAYSKGKINYWISKSKSHIEYWIAGHSKYYTSTIYGKSSFKDRKTSIWVIKRNSIRMVGLCFLMNKTYKNTYRNWMNLTAQSLT